MKKERTFLALMLAVLFMIMAGLFLPKPGLVKVQRKRFWALKTYTKTKHNLIILGDSRAYRGVSPEAMHKILPGIDIFNFGFSSGRLNKFIYKQGEKRLDLNGKTKIILLAVTPNALTKHPDENAQINSQLYLPKEEIYQRIYFAPLLTFFTSVKPEDFKQKKKKVNYVEKFHDDGWVESYKIPEDTTFAMKSYRKWFTKTDVNPGMVNDLILQTKEWSNKGIKVFAYRPPSTYSMEFLEDSLANFREERLIKRFEEAGGIWIPTKSSDYHSYDGSHLRYDSAIKLSEYLAKEIKKNVDLE
ncbi:MAG: hypothetical protein GXO79_08630 [Chlorobi bacterium]|nr:hypothetical protein [Chlorobiota bacterium]